LRKQLTHSAQLQVTSLSAQVRVPMALLTSSSQQRTSMEQYLSGPTEFAQLSTFQQLLHQLVPTQLPTLLNLVLVPLQVISL
jgi:hypothetical protein